MNTPVVFVHVPKCAGASLQEGVLLAAGRDAVFLDYDDNPANPLSDHCIDPAGSARRFAEAASLSGRRIAYGHFHAAKYRAAWPEARWMTVLRDPVERLISHYYFWREDRPFGPHPVRDYMLRHDLTLLEFARLPFSRHFLRGLYFEGLERAAFAYVGRAEDLDAVVRVVGDALGASVPVRTANAGSLRRTDEARAAIDRIRPALAELLAEEIEFYRRWTA